MWDLLLAGAAWYLCGVVGFLYWWTEDFQADARTVAEALVFGAMGPATVLAGWLIHRVLLAGEPRELKPIRIRTDDDRRRPRR
ncbi:hypothetical protein [Azospirillum sp. TSO22-1]|uniref:hypothetical protein n=1 Tax=Azospirillum sp. TSO22-1 TaxID=716789 RepID=UPI000D60C0AB|nr:hypothetical protein [Azospirillum sp. TSO22-1]PWC53577.1 hypothetical protein TSO221_10065 [Azospirillum sp. TSO22-1]